MPALRRVELGFCGIGRSRGPLGKPLGERLAALSYNLMTRCMQGFSLHCMEGSKETKKILNRFQIDFNLLQFATEGSAMATYINYGEGEEDALVQGLLIVS